MIATLRCPGMKEDKWCRLKGTVNHFTWLNLNSIFESWSKLLSFLFASHFKHERVEWTRSKLFLSSVLNSHAYISIMAKNDITWLKNNCLQASPIFVVGAFGHSPWWKSNYSRITGTTKVGCGGKWTAQISFWIQLVIVKSSDLINRVLFIYHFYFFMHSAKKLFARLRTVFYFLNSKPPTYNVFHQMIPCGFLFFFLVINF